MRTTKNEGGASRLKVREWGLGPPSKGSPKAIPLSPKKIFSKSKRPVNTEFTGFFNSANLSKKVV
jgi:hypothetical protein